MSPSGSVAGRAQRSSVCPGSRTWRFASIGPLKIGGRFGGGAGARRRRDLADHSRSGRRRRRRHVDLHAGMPPDAHVEAPRVVVVLCRRSVRADVSAELSPPYTKAAVPRLEDGADLEMRGSADVAEEWRDADIVAAIRGFISDRRCRRMAHSPTHSDESAKTRARADDGADSPARCRSDR